MVTRIFILFLLLSSRVLAASCLSATSGLFSATSTWTNNLAPTASNDTWTVAAAHTVEYDVTNTWNTPFIYGTLIITAQTRQVTLQFNGTMTVTGYFNIGTASLPILASSTNQETITLVQLSGTGGILCNHSGALSWYVEDRAVAGRIWSPLAAAVTNGANQLVLQYDLQLRTNDVIVVDRTTGTSANSLFLVASYDAPSKTVTLGGTTNFLGARMGGFAVNGGNITSARVAGANGVGLLSRSMVYYQPTKIAGSSMFSGGNNNVITGVRLCNGDIYINTVTGWVLTSCSINAVGTTYSGGFFYYGSGNSVYTSVGFNCAYAACFYWGASSTASSCYSSSVPNGGFLYENPSSTAGNVFNSCIVANCGDGGICYGGQLNTITGCTALYCTSAPIQEYGFNATITSCNIYGPSGTGLYGNGGITYGTSGALVSNCVVSGACYGGLGNGDTHSTFVNCVASNIYQGGLEYSGVDNRFIGCTVSNVTGSERLLYRPSMTSAYNTTRLGAAGGLTDVSMVGNGQSLMDFTRIADNVNSTAWWQTYGVVSSQTAVVYSGGLVAMKHVCTTANQPVRHYLVGGVRAGGTVRWNTWQYRTQTATTQLAELYPENYNPGSMTPYAVSTNTAASNTWQNVELSWTNTNTTSRGVWLWFTVSGATTAPAYSWGEQGSDLSTKVMQ